MEACEVSPMRRLKEANNGILRWHHLHFHYEATLPLRGYKFEEMIEVVNKTVLVGQDSRTLI